MISIIVSTGAPWSGRTCNIHDSQSYVVQCNTSREGLPHGEAAHSRVALKDIHAAARILLREPDTSFLAPFANTSVLRKRTKIQYVRAAPFGSHCWWRVNPLEPPRHAHTRPRATKRYVSQRLLRDATVRDRRATTKTEPA